MISEKKNQYHQLIMTYVYLAIISIKINWNDIKGL